jgi:subtilisin family serine protease
MRAAIFLSWLLALAAAPLAAAEPLVPRELASLARHPQTLVQLDRARGQVAEVQLREAGAVVVSKRLRIWRLSSPAARRLVPRLAVSGALREFEPDFPRAAQNHGNANDPLLPQQWWLGHIGADRVDAPGPGKPVTVIDTGIDVAHPEFAGRPTTVLLNAQRLIGRRDFHGSAVASVVGAPANGVGVVGVYPQAFLRSWDGSPDGVLTASDVISGIGAAAALGPGVISLSLGGFFQSRIEEEAILDAVARGCIVVAAVGNEREVGSPLAFPANLPHVLTVASTNASDQVSIFSSETAGMDLAAPGEAIPVARPGSPTGYSSESGTSFAAPIVAGAVAWVWTARPDLDHTQVIELMRRSSRDVAPVGRDADTGFGLLDIPTALTRPAPAPDPLEPNDTVDQVRPNGVFPAAKRPLTDSSRGRAALTARVDVADDPRDVYRVWVPAGRRVVATVTSSRPVELQQRGPRPRGVAVHTAIGTPARRVVTLTNRLRTGRYLYLSAVLPRNTGFADATYTLTLTTTRAPR